MKVLKLGSEIRYEVYLETPNRCMVKHKTRTGKIKREWIAKNKVRGFVD